MTPPSQVSLSQEKPKHAPFDTVFTLLFDWQQMASRLTRETGPDGQLSSTYVDDLADIVFDKCSQINDSLPSRPNVILSYVGFAGFPEPGFPDKQVSLLVHRNETILRNLVEQHFAPMHDWINLGHCHISVTCHDSESVLTVTPHLTDHQTDAVGRGQWESKPAEHELPVPLPTRESAMSHFCSLVKQDPPFSTDLVTSAFAELREEARQRLLPVREQLTQALERIAGSKFGSLDNNKQVAAAIHSTLLSTGTCVPCPKCGKPSDIVFNRSGAKHGSFRIYHLDDQGACVGRSTIPSGLGPVLDSPRLEGRRRRSL